MCVKSLTIGGQEEVCGVLLRQPSDLIDLLLNLQTLKVVKLGLMALKGAVDIVLSLGEWLSLALWKDKGGTWKKHGEKKCMYNVQSQSNVKPWSRRQCLSP